MMTPFVFLSNPLTSFHAGSRRTRNSPPPVSTKGASSPPQEEGSSHLIICPVFRHLPTVWAAQRQRPSTSLHHHVGNSNQALYGLCKKSSTKVTDSTVFFFFFFFLDSPIELSVVNTVLTLLSLSLPPSLSLSRSRSSHHPFRRSYAPELASGQNASERTAAVTDPFRRDHHLLHHHHLVRSAEVGS